MNLLGTADISLPFYVMLFLFSFIIVPLVSLSVFNFSQARRKQGVSFLIAGFGFFMIFRAVTQFLFQIQPQYLNEKNLNKKRDICLSNQSSFFCTVRYLSFVIIFAVNIKKTATLYPGYRLFFCLFYASAKALLN